MSIRLRHITKPLEILWNRYAALQSSVDEKFSLEEYKKTTHQVAKSLLFKKIEESINRKKKRYSSLDCLQANIGVLQGVIVTTGVFLSLRNKNIPEYLFAKKKLTIGPQLSLTVSVVSILDAVGELFKYISNYHRTKHDRLVSRRREFSKFDKECLEKKVARLQSLILQSSQYKNILARRRSRRK